MTNDNNGIDLVCTPGEAVFSPIAGTVERYANPYPGDRLDIIYIQAKRWRPGNVVGRPEIQKFVGALAGQGAKKGIFITTSSFTREALDYSPRNETKIVRFIKSKSK